MGASGVLYSGARRGRVGGQGLMITLAHQLIAMGNLNPEGMSEEEMRGHLAMIDTLAKPFRE